MTTVVVYEESTRKVIAAIPIKENEAGIAMNGVGFQIFNDTEPVFRETPNGPILVNNMIIINPNGGKL